VDGLISLGELPDTQGIFPNRKIESAKPNPAKPELKIED